MSFPKKGKFFLRPSDGSVPPRRLTFAQEVAAALTKAAAEHGIHVKTVAGWTGANERTAKTGLQGPMAKW